MGITFYQIKICELQQIPQNSTIKTYKPQNHVKNLLSKSQLHLVKIKFRNIKELSER